LIKEDKHPTQPVKTTQHNNNKRKTKCNSMVTIQSKVVLDGDDNPMVFPDSQRKIFRKFFSFLSSNENWELNKECLHQELDKLQLQLRQQRQRQRQRQQKDEEEPK
jgi:hypothetical protein